MHPDSAEMEPSDGHEPADCEELRDQLVHVDNQWRRAVADLDNLRKRYEREVERATAAERERALGYWLATLDDLDRSLEHAGSDSADIIDGVQVIVDGACATLEALGYPRFGEVGDSFDPSLHEVVSAVPASDEIEPNTILAVVKAGYGTAANLLRPAAVVVATGPG